MPTLLATLLLCLSAILPTNPDYYRQEQAWFMMLAPVAIGLWLGRRYSYWLGALFAWAVVDGVRYFGVPKEINPIYRIGLEGHAPHELMMKLVTAFDALSAGGVAQLVLVTAAVVAAHALTKSLKVISWFGLLASAAVIVSSVMGRGAYYALDNPSMDGTLIALLYPVMNLRPQPVAWELKRFKIRGNKTSFFLDALSVIAPIAAIILTHSSMAWFTMACSVAAFLFIDKKPPLAAVVFLAGSVAIGYLLLGKDTFDSNGRTEAWRWAMDFWKTDVDPLWGSGTGSLWQLANTIGELHGRVGKKIFNTLHNDWLQLLFEQGKIGLTLAIGGFATALWKSRQTPWLFASIIGAGALSLGQMFLHMPISAFCIGVLFAHALSKNNARP